MTCVVIEGHMQRHYVSTGNQVVDTASPLGQGRQLPGALDRQLGIEPDHATPLGIDVMIPAPGQGCLGIQCREDDREVRAVLMLLDCPASGVSPSSHFTTLPPISTY